MSSRSLISVGLPPNTLSDLIRCGYETVQDLQTATVEDLEKDLNVSKETAGKIISAIHKFDSQMTSGVQLTQLGAALLQLKTSRRFSTRISGVDNLLQGGLPRGYILEVSGAPGSPKETIALGIMSSFVEVSEEILFINCQNMVPPVKLKRFFEKCPESLELVHYMKIHAMVELMLFIHRLPSVLESHPNVTLLVIASVSSPFQHPNLNLSCRNALLETMKQALTKASSSRNLTIVITSQLATKLLKADGTPGTFDTGARGIMLPQLGPSYLPSGRTYRIILSRNGLASGFAKLLSTPASPQGTDLAEVEAYEGL